MIKVLTLITCPTCKGKGLLPTEEKIFIGGWKYFRHKPCPGCEGSGEQIKWLILSDLARLLEEVAEADKRPRKGIL